MSILSLSAGFVPAASLRRMSCLAALFLVLAAPHYCWALGEGRSRGDQDPSQKPAEAPAARGQAGGELEHPPGITEVTLVPELHTVPVPHDRHEFNVHMVSAARLERDREGIWILDFAFKPLRMKTVEIKGKRVQVHYLYYRVVNRTGKPRVFVPQFIMVNEEGKKFDDNVVPEAVPLIQAREDASIPVLGAVNIMGVIPPSTKTNVDDAVYGVAVWEKWDPKSDRFSIYVRGLSDGYKQLPTPSGGKPVVKYKTLRIDFIRRGDELNLDEKEIELSDPPFDWVYW